MHADPITLAEREVRAAGEAVKTAGREYDAAKDAYHAARKRLHELKASPDAGKDGTS